MDRRICERVAHLNVTQGWHVQQPGVRSVALDDDGRVTQYLTTAAGLVGIGPVEQGHRRPTLSSGEHHTRRRTLPKSAARSLGGAVSSGALAPAGR